MKRTAPYIVIFVVCVFVGIFVSKRAYNSGYNLGSDTAHEYGYEVGYEDGYNRGLIDGHTRDNFDWEYSRYNYVNPGENVYHRGTCELVDKDADLVNSYELLSPDYLGCEICKP